MAHSEPQMLILDSCNKCSVFKIFPKSKIEERSEIQPNTGEASSEKWEQYRLRVILCEE